MHVHVVTNVLVAAAATALLVALPASSATAAAPSPRGPVGGCGAGLQLLSLQTIAERYGRTPTAFDVNKDGFVCLRLAPPPQEGVFLGIVVDNNAAGRG